MRTTSISPLTLLWSFPMHIDMPLHYYNMLKDMIVSCNPLLSNYKYCPGMSMWIQMLLNKKILLFTFRDNSMASEKQLPLNWISCTSAGTGNTRGSCSSSDRKWVYFSPATVFLKNAESKPAKRTWHIMPATKPASYDSFKNLMIWWICIPIWTAFSPVFPLFHPVKWKDWTGYWLYQGLLMPSQYCPYTYFFYNKNAPPFS